MLEICPKNKCTGCSACMNKCPHKAISMQIEKRLGHLYPRIDQELCIDCGACTKVCPSIHIVPFQLARIAYAGRLIDEKNYLSSTSGGAATALAEVIIKQNGVVYGCAMLPDVAVRHIRIDTLSDITKLKGSKYVQSTIGTTYQSIRTDLLQQKKVLFIGTPCQCAGLISYIGPSKLKENLITVDLICHGTPSLYYLQQHVAKKTGKIKDRIVTFRENSEFIFSIYNGSNMLYSSNIWTNKYQDEYYNAFIDGYTYRESCHTCQYAKPERCTDITIGDFWGLKQKMPFNERNGCSVLIPNTPQGTLLISKIQDSFLLFERPLTEAIEGNTQLREPKVYNKKILTFIYLCKIVDISTAYKLITIKEQFYKFSNILKQNIKNIIQKK